MKKKFFATITALLMLVSVFASVPAALADDATEVGGLDFYSMTIHYNQEVLLQYYTTTEKVKNEAGKTVTQNVSYFYNPKAESEDEKYMDSKKNPLRSDTFVIPAGTKAKGNFYQLVTRDGEPAETEIRDGLQYAKFPYTHAFITHIVDKSIIHTADKIDLFGINAPYDDAPYEHQNPNLQYADDGYALAAEKDSNGNNLKIDANGYLIDTNDSIWKNANNIRIELYTAVPVIRKTGEVKASKPVIAITESEDYEWVPYNDRFDENGKIKNIQKMSCKYMVTKDELDAFLNDENAKTLTMYRAESDEAYESAPKNGKTITYIKTMQTDPNKEKDTYFNTDRVFTPDDIARDKNGNAALGTPKIGTTVSNVTIKDITVEIDALGTQLYDDVASDPQQNNSITISINDFEMNANFYKECLDENRISQKDYDNKVTFVLGTAKSVTTRTEINDTKSDYKSADEYGYSPTVKSVSLVPASDTIYSSLPLSASLYINFHIAQQQEPADVFDEAYEKKFYSLDTAKQSTLLREQVSALTEKPPVIEEQSEGFPTWAIIAIAAGAVVIIAVIIVLVVMSGKKKKTTNNTKNDNPENKS